MKRKKKKKKKDPLISTASQDPVGTLWLRAKNRDRRCTQSICLEKLLISVSKLGPSFTGQDVTHAPRCFAAGMT